MLLDELATYLRTQELPDYLVDRLCNKIKEQIFDSGDVFVFSEQELDSSDDLFTLKSLYSLRSSRPIKAFEDVYIVDHMWTTTFPQSRVHLSEYGGLAKRLATFFGMDEGEQMNVDLLWNALWSRFGSYALSSDDYTQWFMMDEVGMAIGNSFSNPNVKCMPIILTLSSGNSGTVAAPNASTMAVSFFWPIQDIAEGDLITRSYLPITSSSGLREALLRLSFIDHLQYEMKPLSLLKETSKDICVDGIESKSRNVEEEEGDSCKGDIGQMTYLEALKKAVKSYTNLIPKPAIGTISMYETSLSSSDQLITLPDIAPLRAWSVAEEYLAEAKRNPLVTLNVYCDRPDHLNEAMFINSTTTVPIDASSRSSHRSQARFKLVDNPEAAHILYLIEHTLDGGESEVCKKDKMLNQFWWNGMLVTKEQMARTVRRARKWRRDRGAVGADVDWFPMTYDLSQDCELLAFVDEFVRREEARAAGHAEVENIWILKRHRGRQSLDYPVTANIACALRHAEDQPRVASEYVSRPSLLGGCKYDLRYYVIVRSLRPLVIARYWLFGVRTALQTYSLSDLESYRSHFTVMSLLADDSVGPVRGEGVRTDPHMDNFKTAFDAEFDPEGLIWDRDVQPKIDNVLRDIFLCVDQLCDLEPEHPSGEKIHTNAGWSLSQPNSCPARAMFGVDILLRESGQRRGLPHVAAGTSSSPPLCLDPMVLEVQWGPDCEQARRVVPAFWEEVLAALYLEDNSNVVLL